MLRPGAASRNTVSLTALLMVASPVSAIWICGWATAAACTAASTGPTLLAAVSPLPVISELEQRGPPSRRDLVLESGVERRMDLGHQPGGLDPGQHVSDRGPEGRRARPGCSGCRRARTRWRARGNPGSSSAGLDPTRPQTSVSWATGTFPPVTSQQQDRRAADPRRDHRPWVTCAPPADDTGQPPSTTHTAKLGVTAGSRAGSNVMHSREQFPCRTARGPASIEACPEDNYAYTSVPGPG